jgi:hypothetical protein
MWDTDMHCRGSSDGSSVDEFGLLHWIWCVDEVLLPAQPGFDSAVLSSLEHVWVDFVEYWRPS